MDHKRFEKGYLPLFLSYYKPHLNLFLLDMCCALGIALVDLAFPYASRMALNELLPQNLFGAFFAVMAGLCRISAGLLGGGAAVRSGTGTSPIGVRRRRTAGAAAGGRAGVPVDGGVRHSGVWPVPPVLSEMREDLS